MKKDDKQGLDDILNSILQLANTHFDSLSQSEKELIQFITLGKEACYSSGDEELDKPENHFKWDESRIIQGELIAWLCGNPSASALIHYKGVRVRGAIIKGKVDLEGAILLHPLSLEDCVILDELVLRNAVIRNLILSGSITGPINAYELHVNGSVLLNKGFHAKAHVNLGLSQIDGTLNCQDGRFEKGKDNTMAINAGRMTTYGQVIMSDGFHATGTVYLDASQIGWNLSCDHGTFDGDGNNSLSAAGLETRNGSVFLKNITAKGCVTLDKARIRYNLHCEHSRFESTNSKALKAEGLIIEGSVFLSRDSETKKPKHEGFESQGEVSLTRADIGGNLDCQGAKFINAEGYALSADYIRVRGGLILSEMKINPDGIVNLHQAQVGSLQFDETSWPKEIDIDGLEYKTLSVPTLTNNKEGDQKALTKELSKWLRAQTPKRFSTQPYEHLYRILRAVGEEEIAKEIAIAKQQELRKKSRMNFNKRFFDWLLDIIARYGYRPGRVLWLILAFIALGSFIFNTAYANGKMFPSKIGDYIIPEISKSEEAYPAFNPIAYSLDVFIPLVDLHHQDHWEPHPKVSWSWFYRGYTWAHTFFGWILSTLAAVSFAGIIRKT